VEPLNQLSADERAQQERWQQDRWEKARLDRLSQLEGAFLDGIQEGIKEGRKEGLELVRIA